jgi:uncharacterized membrane protein YphA (DoxX/SURF4 family)
MLKIINWSGLVLRMLIGSLFILSGIEKLLSPYQNFLYVIQSYEFFPSFIEELAARILPWFELFLGIFFLLGLWIRPVLFGLISLFGAFVVLLISALLRQLPITECGCFGEAITLPPWATLSMDSFFLILLILFARNQHLLYFRSLDKYFER